MLKLNRREGCRDHNAPGRRWAARWLVVAGAALAIAAPAAAGNVYMWEAEDGSVAYADELKKVPARYRDQVKSQASASLTRYKRFTPQDSKATGDYAVALEARLEGLRNRSHAPVYAASSSAPAAERGSTGAKLLSIGSANGTTLQIDPGLSGEPVVVETVFSRPRGSAVTRQLQVVKQGDRTIAVTVPRLREWNPSSDVVDEDEILP